MKSFSRWMAWGSLVGAVAVTACGSNAETDAAAAAQEGVSEAPPEVAHMGFIREALASLTLRPDQKPIIEQLEREAVARHEPIHKARTDLQAAIADQIASGKLDRAALKPQIDALTAAIEQSRAADRVALGRLHDVLDKDQRNQFVDSIEAHFKARRDARPGLHHARQWAADLNLTDAQRDQIRGQLRARFEGQREGMKEQWHAVREQGRQMLESFRQDQFTPPAVAFGRDKIERGVGRMLDFADAAMPVLSPEQRAAAAQKIRLQQGRF